MTDPQLAHTFDWGRMYSRVRGGHPEVPSITTVLGVLAQDLEWWEALCAVNACVEHAERVVLLKDTPEDPYKWSEMRKAKDWFRDAAERDRQESSARGDVVHNYAETYALRAMGLATDEDVKRHWSECESKGLLDYVASFHSFWMDYSPEPVQAEATVWNKSVGYAGTTDLICNLDVRGRKVQTVLDWKTRKALFKRNGQPKGHDLHDYTGMQLTSAAMAEEVWLPGNTPSEDRWEPFPYAPEVGLAVALAPDGYSVRQFDIYHPLVWQTFCSLRSAWDFVRDGALTMSPKLSGPDAIKQMTPRPSGLVGGH